MEQVKTVVDKPDFEKMAEDWARDNDWPADYTIYEPLKEGYKAGAEKIWNDYLSTPKPEAVVSLQEVKTAPQIFENHTGRSATLAELTAMAEFERQQTSQFKEENERLKAENTELHLKAAELHSLRMSILESPLKKYFPEKDISFHDKVVFAIHDLVHVKLLAYDQMQELNQSLTEENTRLREALEKIREVTSSLTIEEIAVAALQPQK
jgi:regulator of replication initiation timing